MVTAQQIDGETMAVAWGGFRDRESNIHGFTTCIGTQPGGQDIAECVDLDKDQRKQFNGLSLGGRDRQSFYVSVMCRNGEGLESVVVDRVVIDDSGPEVMHFLMYRRHDNAYVSDPLIKSSDVKDIRMKIQVVEDNPEQTVTVALVETAVGLGPSSYQDAAAWSEVTIDWARSAPLAEIAITGLDLRHGSQYYVHVRTTNTVGRQAITTAPTRIFIDTTPARGLYVHTHNGASIMLEYRLDWKPLSEGNPTHSATYWQVGSTWAFHDAESEVAGWEVSLHDADGNPTQYLASTALQPQETTVLFEGLSFPHLFRYELRVRCLNVANIWSEMYSPIVTIDRTRPFVRQALDLSQIPLANTTLGNVPKPGSDLYAGLLEPEMVTPAEEVAVELDFVTELSGLTVAFASWDVDSGVPQVLVAAGVAPGSTTLVGWTPVQTHGRRYVHVPLPTGVTLQRHIRYYTSVAAVNVSSEVRARACVMPPH